MTSRRRTKALPAPPDWQLLDEIGTDRGTLRSGVEFKVRGERGSYRFLHAVYAPGRLWITAYGGDADPSGYRSVRSFHPCDVSKVLRKPRLRRARPWGGEK